MSRRCDLSGKCYLKGHQVSYSNRKSRKLSQPNLQWRPVWVESSQRYVRMLLSTRAIRTMTKNGVERALREA